MTRGNQGEERGRAICEILKSVNRRATPTPTTFHPFSVESAIDQLIITQALIYRCRIICSCRSNFFVLVHYHIRPASTKKSGIPISKENPIYSSSKSPIYHPLPRLYLVESKPAFTMNQKARCHLHDELDQD